jgi:spoIIIJ-associated protein
MKRQFFSGNSLEQAVMLAARHFGIEPERVAYTVREKKHGFLKVRRRFVIEVDPTAPERPPEEPAPPVSQPAAVPRPAVSESTSSAASPAPRPPARPASRGDREDGKDSARRFERTPLSETASVERAVREILRFLKLEAEVSVERRSDVFEVEISETERDVLLDEEGRTLQAMEYLVPRLVRSWMGQGVPVKVDCEGVRAGREQELRELAARVADQVRRGGPAQSLEPMSPADRRLVHLALADDPDVETESEGTGYYKRVRVLASSSLADRI